MEVNYVLIYEKKESTSLYLKVVREEEKKFLVGRSTVLEGDLSFSSKEFKELQKYFNLPSVSGDFSKDERKEVRISEEDFQKVEKLIEEYEKTQEGIGVPRSASP